MSFDGIYIIVEKPCRIAGKAAREGESALVSEKDAHTIIGLRKARKANDEEIQKLSSQELDFHEKIKTIRENASDIVSECVVNIERAHWDKFPETYKNSQKKKQDRTVYLTRICAFLLDMYCDGSEAATIEDVIDAVDFNLTTEQYEVARQALMITLQQSGRISSFRRFFNG